MGYRTMLRTGLAVLSSYLLVGGLTARAADDDENGAIVLGLCQLCNHSYEPNTRYEERSARRTMVFTAVRDIPRGAEVTINYGGDSESRDKVWFIVRK